MPESPFKLLDHYGPEEKNNFFGRDAEIVALYHLLKQTRLVLIYGESGTGKTSLIQAGLPKVFKTTDWFRVAVRRKDNINQSLQDTLTRFFNGDPSTGNLVDDIQKLYKRRWIPIYLVFDQFEEIFTLGNEKERTNFFSTIQNILAIDIPCKIILSMREEYIGHLYDYEPQVPTLFEKRFRVESMKDATVLEVIEKTCLVNGVILEHEQHTAQEILKQIKLGKQAAYLPYLQIYLHYLYEHSIQNNQPAVFNKKGIESIGALGNVLKTFINTKTSEAQIHLTKYQADPGFAQRLLDEFATSEGTKQSRKVHELSQALQSNVDLVREALLYYSHTAKLLRADENDVERYEPVHDVVAQQIHELRNTENKDFKIFVRKLELDFQRWEEDQESNQRLLPQLDLNKVEVYQEKLERQKSFQHWQAFIQKSQRHQASIRRNKRILNTVLMGITLFAIVASIFAFSQRNKTKKALVLAEEKKEEAQSALNAFKTEEAKRQAAEANEIITFVKNIESRSQQLLELNENYYAKRLLQDARDTLLKDTYLFNNTIQEKLKEVEDRINQIPD